MLVRTLAELGSIVNVTMYVDTINYHDLPRPMLPTEGAYSERDYVCCHYKRPWVAPTHASPYGRTSTALSPVGAEIYSDCIWTTTPATMKFESPDHLKLRDPGVIHTSHNLPTKKKNGTGFRLTQWLKLEVTVVKGGEGWGLSPSLFSDKKTLIFGRNEHPKKNRDFLTQVAFPTRQRIKKKLRSRAKFFRIPHS